VITVSIAIEDKALLDDVRACFDGEPVQLVSEQSQVGDLTVFFGKLVNSRPDMILIDVSALRDPVLSVLQRIRAVAPDSFLIALDTTGAAAATVLDCFRAGANEYLFPPIAEGLRKSLRRKLRDKAQEVSISAGRTVAFLSAKGGCGATTIACHVAAALGRMELKTLLADFDVDGGMVGFVMKCGSAYSIADALRNTHRLDANYWRALVSNGHPGLEVIRAPESLANRQRPEPDQIRDILEFARARYRWTIADFGRGANEVTMTAIETADEVCLVTTPDIPALHRCKTIVQAALDGGIPAARLRLIVNRLPKRSEMPIAELQKLIGFPIFAALQDGTDALHDAYARGQLLPPASEQGRQIAKLARKLAGVEETKSNALISLFKQGTYR
jgi:pilus assembly protein CpaE